MRILTLFLGAASLCSCSAPPPVVREASESERAVLVATISGRDSSNEFGSVRSVLTAPDGSVFIVDNGNRVIARFDSLGRFLSQLGREGAGPAEYRDPYSLAWIGDTLALLDPGNGRIGLFDENGGWIGQWRVPLISGDQFIRLYRTPPDGFWAYAPLAALGQGQSGFVHYTAEGPRDTVSNLRDESSAVRFARCDIASGMTFFTAPFASRLLVIPAPERQRAVVRTDAYRIVFLSPSGDTVRVIEQQFTPAPISDSEWTASNTEFRAFREKNPKSPCTVTEFPRPPSKPAVGHLFFGADGILWVEVVTADGRRYDGFDRNGRLLRSVWGLPGSRGIDPSVRGNRVAMVVRDSLELPAVNLYRIERTR